MSVEVKPGLSRRDLREFIELPYRLHSNAENWIPPLRIERLFLNPRLNAYFKHGEAQLLLARSGRVVGRVSAQIDTAFNEFHDNAWGMFGFLELENDPELMRPCSTRRGLARERGRDLMVGPMDFSMNDESGVLIEGYERPAMVRQPWHLPYYQELCEAAGLEKAMDLFMWQLHISGRDKVMPIIWDLAEQLEPKHGIRIRKMSRRHLRASSTPSPRSTTRPGRATGASCPTRRPTSTPTRRSSSCPDKNWFMVAEDAGGKTIGIA